MHPRLEAIGWAILWFISCLIGGFIIFKAPVSGLICILVGVHSLRRAEQAVVRANKK